MDELERLRQERIRQRIQEMQNESDDEARLQQELASLEVQAKKILTKDALQRYSNIKIAHPEIHIKLLVMLAKIAQSGKGIMINDMMLKELLSNLANPKREMNIKR